MTVARHNACRIDCRSPAFRAPKRTPIIHPVFLLINRQLANIFSFLWATLGLCLERSSPVSSNISTDMVDVKIYVIEDDASERAVMVELAEEVSTSVQSFVCPEDFESVFDDKNPSVIICDYYFRRTAKDGGDFLRHFVRTYGAAAPFIIISGFVDVKKASELQLDGAYICIPKPIDASLVMRVLRKAINDAPERLDQYLWTLKARPVLESLNRKTLEVLLLKLCDFDYKTISRKLNFGIKNVGYHVNRLRDSQIPGLPDGDFRQKQWAYLLAQELLQRAEDNVGDEP